MLAEQLTLLRDIYTTMSVRAEAADVDANGAAELRKNAVLIQGIIRVLDHYHTLCQALRLALSEPG